MVEFALVAPLGLLLVLGIAILGLVEMDSIQVTNLTRDAARGGAICGSANRAAGSLLPDGSTCSYAHLQTYITNRLKGLPSGSPSKPATGSFGSNCDKTAANSVVCVWTSSHGTVAITGSNPLDACAKGDELEVVTQYNAQLYISLLGKFFGNGSTKPLLADATATCEQ